MFYLDYCLIISTSKDKIYAVYVYLKKEIEIEDDIELNKYLDIELDHFPDGSIHL